MIVNKSIYDVMRESDKTIVYISNRTGYTLERLMDIIQCKTSVSPIEAHNILNVLGASLSDVICAY